MNDKIYKDLDAIHTDIVKIVVSTAKLNKKLNNLCTEYSTEELMHHYSKLKEFDELMKSVSNLLKEGLI